MSTTLTITDDLANQLKPYEAEIGEILGLGIREWQARREIGYNGVSSVLEKLAALPSPEEVLALRPAPPLMQRLEYLLENTRNASLSPEEQNEWEQYQYLEHLVRMAKGNALRKLKEAGKT